MNARSLALAALNEWRQGRHFADTIVQRLLARSTLSGSDRGFTTELVYGVLRNLTLLDFWIEQLRSGSLDHGSRDLLRLGLYQLFCLRTPGHAAVFETVELSGRRNRGLINGVLREALRRAEELQSASAAEPLTTRFSHPSFLIERWTTAFGDEATASLCQWNNQAAPVYARINRLRIDPADFLKANPTAQVLSNKEDFVRLPAIPTEALERGECYIQDPSTALSCELLDPQPGEVVLDACAAPGGKSGLIGQMMQNRGQLSACDRDPARIGRLRENLERLGVTAEVVQHDWKSGELPPALKSAGFDRILLDAPCSNTGVIRRRVDVRWRLTSADFSRAQQEQLAILQATVRLLKPGGVLVYSTCSLEAEENEKVVEQILEQFPFLELSAEQASLPFRDGFDGAFAARLVRVK